MKFFKALKFCAFAAFATVGVSFLINEDSADFLSRAFITPEQRQSVVRVDVDHTNGNTDKGSGVLIRADLVLTADHVVRDAKSGSKVIITFKGGLRREAEILKTSKLWDLALLQFDSVLYTPAKPAKMTAIKQQVVTICGFPHGGDYVEAIGRVVGFRSPDRTSKPNLFVVNQACESGMSGGPVFNDSGDVVGTLFGSLRFANCTGLDVIKEFIHEQPIPRQDRKRTPKEHGEPDGGDSHEPTPIRPFSDRTAAG